VSTCRTIRPATSPGDADRRPLGRPARPGLASIGRFALRSIHAMVPRAADAVRGEKGTRDGSPASPKIAAVAAPATVSGEGTVPRISIPSARRWSRRRTSFRRRPPRRDRDRPLVAPPHHLGKGGRPGRLDRTDDPRARRPAVAEASARSPGRGVPENVSGGCADGRPRTHGVTRTVGEVGSCASSMAFGRSVLRPARGGGSAVAPGATRRPPAPALTPTRAPPAAAAPTIPSFVHDRHRRGVPHTPAGAARPRASRRPHRGAPPIDGGDRRGLPLSRGEPRPLRDAGPRARPSRRAGGFCHRRRGD
jgi:hypothetical protein